MGSLLPPPRATHHTCSLRATVVISLALLLVIISINNFWLTSVSSLPGERLLLSISSNDVLRESIPNKDGDGDHPLAFLFQAHDALASLVDAFESFVNQTHDSNQPSATSHLGSDLLEALTKHSLMNDSSTPFLPGGDLLASIISTSHGNNPLASFFRHRLSRKPCPLTSSTGQMWGDDWRDDAIRRDIAICAVFRNEARILDEWIAFHYLQGVKYFILYDDKSSDKPAQVLDKYIAMGIVELRNVSWAGNVVYQIQHQNDCIQEGRELRDRKGSVWEGINWLLLTDVDEFAYTNAEQEEPLADIVHRLWNDKPCVRLNRVDYGSSYWHKRPTEGLIMENYLLRSKLCRDRHPKLLINLQPLAPDVETVTQVMSMHSVRLSNQTHRQPCVDRPSRGVRINHYLRSLEDYETKIKTHRLETSRYAKDPLKFWWDRDLNLYLDDEMAVRYACPVQRFIHKTTTWYNQGPIRWTRATI